LDCFGDEKIIGKVGTDIQDHKCSWLIVQALLRATAAQRAIIESCYGRKDSGSVKNIKELYIKLGLKDVYAQQEQQSFHTIVSTAKAHNHLIPATIFFHILDMIHQRQK